MIVPVYNPGNGIRKCIQSLRDQTLKEIEIIFVDDCGSDRAMEAVKKAASEDPRIRYLTNTENIGAGRSRNKGIKEAAGEYLSFVDADDYVAPDFLQRLYSRAAAERSDIVKGSCVIINPDGPLTAKNSRTLNETIREGLNQGELLCALFSYEHWSAVYRREMILGSGSLYGSSNNGEDACFLLNASYAARSFSFEETAVYYYVTRDNSSDMAFVPERFGSALVSLRERMDFIVKNRIDSPEIYFYAVRMVQRYLSLHSACSADVKLKNEADCFLKTVYQYTDSIPFKKKMYGWDTAVDMFLDLGENISTEIINEEKRIVPYREYWCSAERVVRFIQRHPETGKACQGLLWGAFEHAVNYPWGKNEKEKKKQAVRALRALADSLPDRTILTDGFISMRLLMDHGINLFPLRNTAAGEMIKMQLRIVRSLKAKLLENRKNQR